MSESNVQTPDRRSWQGRFFERDLPVAYLMLRATMGFHMIAHGGTRFPILREFVAESREEFVGVLLLGFLPIFPGWLITIITYTIPPAEFAIGLLLAVGFKTRLAATAGSALFLVMMFGQVAMMNFGTAHMMWFYVMVFAILGALSFADRYSVDRMGK
jgi:thiosulfate dehydrogenase [quinone] large subunit